MKLLKTFFKNWLKAIVFLTGTVAAIVVPMYIGILLNKHHTIAVVVYVVLLFTGLFAWLITIDGGLGW